MIRITTGVLLVVLLGISGCLSMIKDPLGRRGSFNDTQAQFTQYVRWGKFQEASQFVDPEIRAEFMSYAPEFSDLRFSDYEIIGVDIQDGVRSASVEVRFTAYHLSMPFERSVDLTQEWTRSEATGIWTVKVDIKKLRDTLIGVP
jgi:hypothetical protein